MNTNFPLLGSAFARRLMLALALAAAGLICSRAAGAPMTINTNWPVGLPVPGPASGGLTNTQVISAPFTAIGSVRVSLNVTGEFNGDLSAILRHDSGAVVLLNRVGRTAANPGGYDDTGMNVTFDDVATNGNVHVYRRTLNASHTTPLGGPLTGSWQPDGRTNDPTVVLDTDAPATALSAFRGRDPNGEWTLFLIDWEPPDVLSLVSWGLEITELDPASVLLGPVRFDRLPSTAEWSTISVATGAATFATAAVMDAAVQAVEATSINGALTTSATVPPGTAALAQWNSALQLLVTRPTGVGMTLLRLRLLNNSGITQTSLTISYDLGVTSPAAEDVPGHLVYFSLTGASGSWQQIAALSGDGTAGAKTAVVDLSATPWPHGSEAYLLWADDNGPATDAGYTLDNLIIDWPDILIELPIIAQQPQGGTAECGRLFGLSAVATSPPAGGPLSYQWDRDNDGVGDDWMPIPGATGASLSLAPVTAATLPAYRVRVSNAAGSVTSQVAIVTIRDRTPPVVCANPPQAFQHGTADEFEGPEPASPSFGLRLRLSAVDVRGFDEPRPDAFFADSFVNLPSRLTQARLRLRLRAGEGFPEGDFLFLGFVNPDGSLRPERWERRLGRADVFLGLLGEPWTNGVTATLDLDLARLPNESGAPSDLLPLLAQTRALDIIIQDDTDVDYLVIETAACACGPDIPLTVAPGEAGALATFPTPLFFDDCDPAPVVSCLPPSGGFFPLGTNAVTCTATDSGGNSGVCAFNVVVSSGLPVITQQPQSLTVTQGQSATFSVAATGAPPLSYQWHSEPPSLILEWPDEFDFTISLSNAQPSHAGNYYVVVSNAAGSMTSAVATLTVVSPPVILVQPQSQTIRPGSNAVFSVVATGTAPLAYQWSLNDTNIPGATNATYIVAHLSGADVGLYEVTVSNVAGLIKSGKVHLLCENYCDCSIRFDQPTTLLVCPGNSFAAKGEFVGIVISADLSLFDCSFEEAWVELTQSGPFNVNPQIQFDSWGGNDIPVGFQILGDVPATAQVGQKVKITVTAYGRDVNGAVQADCSASICIQVVEGNRLAVSATPLEPDCRWQFRLAQLCPIPNPIVRVSATVTSPGATVAGASDLGGTPATVTPTTITWTKPTGGFGVEEVVTANFDCVPLAGLNIEWRGYDAQGGTGPLLTQTLTGLKNPSCPPCCVDGNNEMLITAAPGPGCCWEFTLAQSCPAPKNIVHLTAEVLTPGVTISSVVDPVNGTSVILSEKYCSWSKLPGGFDPIEKVKACFDCVPPSGVSIRFRGSDMNANTIVTILSDLKNPSCVPCCVEPNTLTVTSQAQGSGCTWYFDVTQMCRAELGIARLTAEVLTPAVTVASASPPSGGIQVITLTTVTWTKPPYSLGLHEVVSLAFDCVPASGVTVVFRGYGPDGSTSELLTKTLANLKHPSCAPCCTPPPPNMTLWLQFDELNGHFIPNAAGPNPGVRRSGVSLVNGFVGSSLAFDGVEGNVAVLPYDGVNFGTGDFSLDAWVRREAGDDGIRIIVDKRFEQSSGEVAGSSVARGYSLFLDDGVLKFQLADGTHQNFSAGMTVPADGGWHHVAVTVRRNAADGGRFYLDYDGVNGSVAFNPTARPGSVSTDQLFRVGARSMAPSGFFKGGIDEVEAFARALAPEEIAALYGAGGNGKCRHFCQAPPMAVYCPLDTYVEVTALICNSSPVDADFNVAFHPSPVGPPGIISTVAGPPSALFTLLDPANNPVHVAAHSCRPVKFRIARPGQLTAGNVACYEMEATAFGTTEKIHCRGAVRAKGASCYDFFPVGDGTATNHNPAHYNVALANGGGAGAMMAYELVASWPMDTGSVQFVSLPLDTVSVSLNGLPPGSILSNAIFVPAGGMVTIPVTAEFVTYGGLQAYPLVLRADADGNGVFTPVASTLLRNVLAATCPVTITRQPASQTVIDGSPGQLEVEALGTGVLAYEWAKDGVPIAGATNRVLTLTASPASAGAYRATVADDLCPGLVLSTPATLRVVGPPIVFRRDGPGLILEWPDETWLLQSTTTLAEPNSTTIWTNVPDATSPYSVPLVGPGQFFRTVWR